MLLKYFNCCFVAQYLSRFAVNFALDFSYFFVTVLRDVAAFWNVAPDQAIDVFYATFFPGVVRFAELDWSI